MDETLVNQQIELFNDITQKAKIYLSENQINNFKKYIFKLLEWNKRINLISKNDEPYVVRRHFLESIAILAVIDFPLNCSIVDVGTGGGFPGLPIKIVRPDIHLTLIDSKRKKILFLSELNSFLNLDKITIINGRAEHVCLKKEFKNKYDFVIARAVTNLNLLYQWTFQFLKGNGVILSFKSGNIETEIFKLQNEVKKVNIKIIPFSSDLIPLNKNYFIAKLST